MGATTSNYREFSIEEYGSGEPRILVIGGASFAQEDFAKLEGVGRLIVPNNPFHHGLPRPENMREWMRERLLEICLKKECTSVIGHSSGCDAAMHIQRECANVKEAILLCFPSAENKPQSAQKARLFEGDLLDTTLAALTDDLDNEMYRALYERHQKTYGSTPAGVKQMCKKDVLKNEERAALVKQLLAHPHPALVLNGTIDPWSENFPSSYPHNITVLPIEGGSHYMFISKFELIKQAILDWRMGSQKNPSFVGMHFPHTAEISAPL